jgi:hypothetical protein
VLGAIVEGGIVIGCPDGTAVIGALVVGCPIADVGVLVEEVGMAVLVAAIVEGDIVVG